jgi:hypothetical protein
LYAINRIPNCGFDGAVKAMRRAMALQGYASDHDSGTLAWALYEKRDFEGALAAPKNIRRFPAAAYAVLAARRSPCSIAETRAGRPGEKRWKPIQNMRSIQDAL